MVTGQFTVGTTKVQFPHLAVQPQYMTIINAGGTGTVNVGDITVDTSLGGIQNGVPLAPGDAFTFQLGQDYSTRMTEFWAISTTAGSIINFILI
jgi:hypothetical protein